jgi:hypothetical protein
MHSVVVLADLDIQAVERLLDRYGLELLLLPDHSDIPASFWGAPEAGLGARSVFARADTPAHSLLHETSHFICMTPDRRNDLWRDAGGDDIEECAVCYLQILLGDEIPDFGSARLLDDLDTWGYSFREGSARAWFIGDGADAKDWLVQHRLIDRRARLTHRLRSA